MPLAGGIMQHGYQCGMLWGAALAAGARAHRLLGPGPKAEARAIAAARRLVESFRAQNAATDCFDITGLDESSSPMQMFTHFFIKGGSIGCFRMAARYAPVAFGEIGAALANDYAETPPATASCAALLARKMGASDLHATMVAGFAGGIGLHGGACGALGAAIWLMGRTRLAQGAAKVGFDDPGARDVIERFLKCTRYEFECSAIVGRKFDGVADHAAHLRGGGCAGLIDALAAAPGRSA